MSEPDPPASLSDFPVVIQLPVQWGDQDAYGHVNNVVYFRWYESARIAYLQQVGLDSLMDAGQIGPILAFVKCDYRRQLNFPDRVHVGARVERIGRTSIQIVYRVYSEALDAVAADGDSVVAIFDYAAQKPVPVPDDIRAAIGRIP